MHVVLCSLSLSYLRSRVHLRIDAYIYIYTYIFDTRSRSVRDARRHLQRDKRRENGDFKLASPFEFTPREGRREGRKPLGDYLRPGVVYRNFLIGSVGDTHVASRRVVVEIRVRRT